VDAELRHTPLVEEHLALGAKMGEVTADGEFDIFMKTTVADVQRVARRYLVEPSVVIVGAS